ncbi:chromosomal replication initiator protein DnaA [Fibrivirga algicola]|uniref:Chromosomal replication initiator protein DnaA n=1 Tax=Fibrivirga algicola TaxID=2950420 RepID=A0ABX0QN87_9BACT|nr:chromosomal replication initiator protein DnaA [Fibrivirga algicola]ARK13682.1 chromosomal replication initiation protein DnaA [Fibrella sp. ES10-3-2-2]NID12615.1 chromosomal replication initiator protein DnaA [Fibrivirga algicola]
MQREVHIVWNNCLRVIQEIVPEPSFKTWFEPIIPVRLNGKVLTIQVPSEFFYEWLEENFIHALRKALDYAIGRDGQLEYSIVVDQGDAQNRPIAVSMPTTKSPQSAKPDNVSPVLRSPFALKDLDSLTLDSYLNPTYTFDNYVEGDCNRLARNAGFAVASRPGVTSFNPLMIYGGVGLGKTHLVQAIGNFIKNNNQDKFVLYVTSEKFTNQFLNAIRTDGIRDFTSFYMQVDVLVIDDVQFLQKKEKTQEIFFHIFNHLHQSGKQIIMTSDRSPRALDGLEDRLLSRFKWGLTTDLQTPDLETRIAIIQKKLQAEGVYIDDGVIEYLAHSINTNVRELEGVVVSLMAQASLNRREIDLDLAKATLRNIVVNDEKEINIDTVQELVADFYNTTIADLKSKSRKREVVYPRQVAMYLAKELTELSLKSIGYHFGGRDHSTVIHAIQLVNDLLKENPETKEQVAKLKAYFK